MKSYTDLEQSKKLTEILPLESADMRYGYIAPYEFSDRMYEGGYDDVPYPKDFMKKNPNFSEDEYDGELPCWSLAALLKCLSEIKPRVYTPVLFPSEGKWILQFVEYSHGNMCEISYDNPIDACVEMVIKLHELNLL